MTMVVTWVHPPTQDARKPASWVGGEPKLYLWLLFVFLSFSFVRLESEVLSIEIPEVFIFVFGRHVSRNDHFQARTSSTCIINFFTIL